jgi:hypothetical protein
MNPSERHFYSTEPGAFFLDRQSAEQAAKKGDDPLYSLFTNDYLEISKDFDLTYLQDSWSWRNAYLARELATFLFDEKGEIDNLRLTRTIELLEANAFSLSLGGHHDGPRQLHLLSILKLIKERKEFAKAIKRIDNPIGHQGAEQLIRETLFLADGISITPLHARQAALSSLLCSLRQNVGSCFATAPAILIQQEQPLQFLADIAELFSKGRLIRTFEGIEYTVPLSVSWGLGDLLKPISITLLGKDSLTILAYSPGLQAAFAAAGLLDPKSSRQEKQNVCTVLLKSCHLVGEAQDPFIYTSADQIIKSVLLQHYNLVEDDIRRFRERPIQGPFAQLMIQAPSLETGKSLSIDRYLKAYGKAIRAFKTLTDNALLKAWEFTLASLSEAHADFAKWNLYLSLGVQPEERYGIGETLHQVIQKKIDQINNELQAIQGQYDHLFAQAKYLEGRISRISSEREAGWIQAEYHIRRQEINRVLSERDVLHEKGRQLQIIYNVLIDFYGKKIRDYFQEVYDAEMHDVSANPYDDSPAGFRLLYKHGRSNTALWTPIFTSAEYIQYLTSFFVMTEIELKQLPHMEGLEKEISELVTAAITAIKRPEFIESSLYRLARAYKEPLIDHPLEHLDKVKRKPWSYVSGGTMATLVSCYWENPQKPEEKKRWVENENELLAFLIDCMKESPFPIQKAFQQNSSKSLLAFSPTHAFLCKPGWKKFREAWENDLYTYTWIRDSWAAGHKKFLDSLLLDHRMMEIIIHHLLRIFPVGYRPIVKHALRDFSYPLSPSDFKERLIKALSYEKWLKRLDLISEELDSILYRTLPLFPDHAIRDKLMLLFGQLDIDQPLREKIDFAVEKIEESVNRYTILTAEDLRNYAKGILVACLKGTHTSLDYHKSIVEAMQETELCYPQPILIGDTNWVKNVFGFTVNPGTKEIEFWRFDHYGSEGRPMSAWKSYFSSKSRDEWGLYIQPNKYNSP